jgi:hypothetical protein
MGLGAEETARNLAEARRQIRHEQFQRVAQYARRSAWNALVGEPATELARRRIGAIHDEHLRPSESVGGFSNERREQGVVRAPEQKHASAGIDQRPHVALDGEPRHFAL